MLHTRFQDYWTSGSGDEDFFIGFYHIWVWRPSWSCDLYHLYNFRSHFPRRLHMKLGIDWPIDFREEDV